MNANVRLEEILHLLKPGEFVGRVNSAYAGKIVWAVGRLDERGVLQGVIADDTLTGLCAQIEKDRR